MRPALWTAQQGPPHGSALGSKQEPSGFWQQTGTHGFLDKGDVMIRRLCLVAGPARSEWRTRRPD